MKERLRALLLGRTWVVLTVALGLLQVVIGHWFWVVLAGREGPGLVLGLALAGLLVALNLRLMPILRPAMRARGVARWLARAYVTVGVATLVLGTGVVLLWAGALPVGAVLGLLGLDAQTAFQAFRFASAAVVLIIAALLLWGFTLGQSLFEHTHVVVPVEGLHDAHRGLRIVQISDLHIGNGMEGTRLGRLVARVNALDPDVVALTGDLFDFDPAWVEEGARGLAGLRARLGVFAVLGNHDTYTGSETVAEALARHAPHVRLLRGHWERLPGEAPLYVAGVDDPGRLWSRDGHHLRWPDLPRLAAERPDDGPVVLLVHRPEAFPEAARLGFELVLAGHTHGGQLAVPWPGLGERWSLGRILTPFHRGLFREGRSHLYVNRGAGVAGPAIRIGSRREITTLELR
ncbi:MAG: metallophosphoesterase [Myxococcota bacterium]|nr:metallophosphoesterase [Myxococcota bacterium]